MDIVGRGGAGMVRLALSAATERLDSLREEARRRAMLGERARVVHRPFTLRRR
jgi:hypothetical protein